MEQGAGDLAPSALPSVEGSDGERVEATVVLNRLVAATLKRRAAGGSSGRTADESAGGSPARSRSGPGPRSAKGKKRRLRAKRALEAASSAASSDVSLAGPMASDSLTPTLEAGGGVAREMDEGLTAPGVDATSGFVVPRSRRSKSRARGSEQAKPMSLPAALDVIGTMPRPRAAGDGGTPLVCQGITVSVPALASGGAPMTAVLTPSEVMARAEGLAAEARHFMADPANKVNRGAAVHLDGAMSGLVSLLGAAVGRLEGLVGECAAVRLAHVAVVRDIGRQVTGALRGLAKRPAPVPVVPRPAVGTVGAAPTYAQMAAPSVGAPSAAGLLPPAIARPLPKRRKPRVPQHVVLVKPAEGQMDAAAVKERLMTLVNPAASAVCVRGVRAVQGGVLVETRTGEDLEFFRSSQELREGGLSVSEPEGPRQMFIVFAVPEGMTEEAVMASLRSQKMPQVDEGSFSGCVRLARKLASRNGGASGSHWILEVTPEVAAKLGRSGRVFLGWHSCPFREYVEVGRCYRCLGFGHTARFCARRAQTCGWCSGDGHSAADCPNKEEAPCCTNCKGAGLAASHGAFDGVCPLYRAELAQEQLRARVPDTTANG